VAPLYVDVWAAHPFEGAKAAAIRTLALVAAGAFAIEARDRLRGGGRDTVMGPWNRWWLVAIGVLASSLVVSTVLSLAPATSLFGSPHRAQGLATTLAYLVLGVIAAASIRSRAQVERAVSVVVLAAVPVAAAAIAEHHGALIFPRPEPVPRAASTLGNPMALGGYLVLALPLAVARLASAVRAAGVPSSPSSRRTAIVGTVLVSAVGWLVGGLLIGTVVSGLAVAAAWLAGAPSHRAATARLAVESTVVGLLLAAFVAAGSRGAGLGLVGAALVWAAVLSGRRASRPSAGTAAAVTAAAVGAISASVLLAHQAGDRFPLFGRLLEPVDSTGGTAGLRITLWRTALDALSPASALQSPDGPDGWRALRPLIGHGPETTDLVLGPVAPAELWLYESRLALPDRAHGALLDTVIQTGAVGLLASVAVFSVAVAAGLRALGVLDGRRAGFLALWVGGAVLGPALVVTVGPPELWGVAMVMGMTAGLLLHLGLGQSARTGATGPVPAPVVIAALGGLVGHWIELQFAFGWATTLTYAWFAFALLVAANLGHDRPGRAPVGRPSTDQRTLGAFGGLLIALILYGLGHGETGALLWIVGLATVSFAALVPPHRDDPRREAAHRLARSPVLALMVTAAALVAAGRLALGDGVIRFTPPIEWRSIVLATLVVGFALVAGTTLVGGWGGVRAPKWSTVAVSVIVGAAVWSLGVAPVQADHLRRMAQASEPVVGVELFERASELELAGHRAAPTAVDLYVRAALSAESDPTGSIEQGIEHLLVAQSRDPFNARHAIALATLHELLAELAEPDDPGRAGWLDQAVGFHREATALRPTAAQLHAGFATALLRRAELTPASPLGTPDELRRQGEEALHRAATLDPGLVLVSSIRARFASDWSAATAHALTALDRLPERGAPSDDYEDRARLLALEALERADSMATEAGAHDRFIERLAAEARSRNVADLYLALAEAHGRQGDRAAGLTAIRTALALTPLEHGTARAAYRQVERTLEVVELGGQD
jgi:hypothetical protein